MATALQMFFFCSCLWYTLFAMQLVLDLDGRARVLAQIHKRLQRHFGSQGPFLQLDPVSQLVMGLIGGKTYGDVSKAAFERLLKRFCSWEALRDAPVPSIEAAIGGVTFSDVKARRLRDALRMITKDRGALTLDHLDEMSVDDALVWLERLPGVGRKVAAVTLNFSTLRKPALVIDTHHLRVLRRLRFVGERGNFVQAYDSIMPLLPSDWRAADFDEHHCLIKTLGQSICRYRAPVCGECPLQELCPTASAGSGLNRLRDSS